MRVGRSRRTLLVMGALVATGALVSGIVMTQGGQTSGADGHYEQSPAPGPAEVTRFFEVMRLAFTGAALDASLRRSEGTRDLVGEAAAAFSAASTTSGTLHDLHEARARRLALLGEDLWSAAPERRGGAGLPDHPRSGFDRSGLEPQPVAGVGPDGLGSR